MAATDISIDNTNRLLALIKNDNNMLSIISITKQIIVGKNFKKHKKHKKHKKKD